MGDTLEYVITADRPAAELWLFDDDGTLLDLSAVGYTFSFKVGVPGEAALLTKSSGITGAVGAGEEPDGTPNCVVTWTAGEIAASSLVAGRTYAFQLTATTTSLDRVFEGKFVVKKAIL
jgi:hypothetical protein